MSLCDVFRIFLNLPYPLVNVQRLPCFSHTPAMSQVLLLFTVNVTRVRTRKGAQRMRACCGGRKQQGADAPLVCIFCHPSLCERTIYEDEEIRVITDIKPKTFIHYLVLPKVHIESVEHLTAENLILLKKMIEVCENLLSQAAPNSPTKIGFHRPPFISVKHLHLHGMALPFTPKWRRVFFSPFFGNLWYLPADLAVDRLQRIKVC
eukprot:Phypoly_transcript_18660.p1 GENE.Phypoly_transcript_18660~~Phypoly_transcript_18660.p1  ORF type:complete len:206 (+),score=15.41 Phypoly_transcript_18660:94-711(+)